MTSQEISNSILFEDLNQRPTSTISNTFINYTYPVLSNSFLLKTFTPHAGRSISVKVKPLKGTIFSVHVDEFDSIILLKKKCAVETGIPISSQRLLLGGKALQDCRTLYDYGINHGSCMISLAMIGNSRSASTSANLIDDSSNFKIEANNDESSLKNALVEKELEIEIFW